MSSGAYAGITAAIMDNSGPPPISTSRFRKAMRGNDWVGRFYAPLALVAGLTIMVSGWWSTPSAYAQSAPDRNVQAAYELALKCFVANGYAKYERRDANDPEGASRYDGKAKHAHDVANKLGEQLGYSGDRIARDYKATMDRELPRLTNEPGYFARVADECKAYGLM